jgi:nicotinate-nucleotide adenylyltransferase
MKTDDAGRCRRRIAIFGGTFDPVHRGHTGLAMAAADELDLDSVVFMPNFISPFKEDREAAPAEDRCRMLSFAMKLDSRFMLSRLEIDGGRPAYTIDTLEYLRKKIDGDLFFLLGFDSVMTLDRWYRGADILSGFPLITSCRPDTSDEEAYAKISHYREEYGAEIHVLHAAPMDYSSTDIRDSLDAGDSIAYAVIPEVEKYIIDNGLYKR